MLAVRATARTASRRVVRALLRSAVGLFLPSMLGARENGIDHHKRPLLSIWIGFFALAVSFAGVLRLTAPSVRSELLQGSSLLLFSLLVASPLLVHSGVMWAACRKRGVALRFQTTFDGLLLQAYFSGAASFMPLASDVELDPDAPAKDRAACATWVLLALLACGLGLELIGGHMGWHLVLCWGGVFLLYAFVFSFPLRPLDGRDIWDHSPWAWLVVWVVVLVLFLKRLPPVLYEVL